MSLVAWFVYNTNFKMYEKGIGILVSLIQLHHQISQDFDIGNVHIGHKLLSSLDSSDTVGMCLRTV